MPIFWIVAFLAKRSQQCLNFSAGIIYDVTQTIVMEIYTKRTIDDAISLKGAADVCA